MDVIESHPGNYVYDVMPGTYQSFVWAPGFQWARRLRKFFRLLVGSPPAWQ